jgi:uncharacterized protein YaaQ
MPGDLRLIAPPGPVVQPAPAVTDRPAWPPTRLALAVVQVEDAPALLDRLVADGFGATRIDASGGFLRRSNALVMVATAEARVPCLLESIRQTCRTRLDMWFPSVGDGLIDLSIEPIEVEVGGAVVFVFPIERAELLGAVGAHEAALALSGRGA